MVKPARCCMTPERAWTVYSMIGTRVMQYVTDTTMGSN